MQFYSFVYGYLVIPALFVEKIIFSILVSVHIIYSYNDICHIGLGHTLMTSF